MRLDFPGRNSAPYSAVVSRSPQHAIHLGLVSTNLFLVLLTPWCRAASAVPSDHSANNDS